MRQPHSARSELAVLAALVLFGGADLDRLDGVLRPEDFHVPQHAIIFAALLALRARGAPIDGATLVDELARTGQLRIVGGPQLVSRIADSYSAARNVLHHAEQVRRFASIRRMMAAAQAVAESGGDEGPEEAEEYLARAEETIRAAAQADGRREGHVRAGVHLRTVYEQLRTPGVSGLRTGFVDLDTLLCGLKRGDLVIVGARPSMGKTAFALDLALAQTFGELRRPPPVEPAPPRRPEPVLFFSLEMGGAQLVNRLLSSCAAVDGHRIQAKDLYAEDWQRMVAVSPAIDAAALYIDDQCSPTVLDMAARARRWRRDPDVFREDRGDTGLIVVDYLQLARGGGRRYESREQEISDVTQGLKNLAKELRVPVIALAQLNRNVDGRTDKRPVLSDLRESGAIEQIADVIMFLYRPEVYESDPAKKQELAGQAEVIVGKQRNGPIGTVLLTFLKQLTRFESAVR